MGTTWQSCPKSHQVNVFGLDCFPVGLSWKTLFHVVLSQMWSSQTLRNFWVTAAPVVVILVSLYSNSKANLPSKNKGPWQTPVCQLLMASLWKVQRQNSARQILSALMPHVQGQTIPAYFEGDVYMIASVTCEILIQPWNWTTA